MNKILFLLYRYPGLGGIETVTTTIANFLINHNFEIIFYSFNSEKQINRIDNRIKIYCSNKINYIEQSEELYYFCNDNKIDSIVLHDNYDINPFILNSVVRNLHCKLFVVEHSDPMGVILGTKRVISRKKHEGLRGFLWLIKNLNYYNKITKHYILRKSLLFNLSNRYIILSERFKAGIKYCLPECDDQKLIYINNPLTVPIVKNNNKQNLVVFIARLEASKRIDYLLEILKEVAPKNTNWQFRIYGDGSERYKIEQFIEQKDYNNIEYCGLTNNVSTVLKDAKILMMTSEYEGWGLVLTEAMANGTVPIAFNSYLSILDIIDDGVDGILVSPFNIAEYCHKLSKLFTNNEEFLKIQENVYKKAIQFKIDNKIGYQWINLLKSNK